MKVVFNDGSYAEIQKKQNSYCLIISAASNNKNVINFIDLPLNKLQMLLNTKSRIVFEDKSYVEIKKTDNKYIFSISAVDFKNPKENITNSVDLTEEQLNLLLK